MHLVYVPSTHIFLDMVIWSYQVDCFHVQGQFLGPFRLDHPGSSGQLFNFALIWNRTHDWQISVLTDVLPLPPVANKITKYHDRNEYHDKKVYKVSWQKGLFGWNVLKSSSYMNELPYTTQLIHKAIIHNFFYYWLNHTFKNTAVSSLLALLISTEFSETL